MKTLEFLSSPGMEWAHFSYMQLYRKLVMMKNTILFLLGKLKQRSCLLLHTYQNKRQSKEECLSNPPTSKQLFSFFWQEDIYWTASLRARSFPASEIPPHTATQSLPFIFHIWAPGQTDTQGSLITANEGQQVDGTLRILAIGSFPCFEFFCSGSPKAIVPITKGVLGRFCWPPQARKGSISSYQNVTWLVVEAMSCVLVGWVDH